MFFSWFILIKYTDAPKNTRWYLIIFLFSQLGLVPDWMNNDMFSCLSTLKQYRRRYCVQRNYSKQQP